jgi:predicted nucleotidyltransferase
VPADFSVLIRALVTHDVRFVVIGGAALILHGSSYVTEDIDLAFERTRENAERIAAALKPFRPRPRGFPADLPFVFDAQTIVGGQILTLQTSIGAVDLLGEVPGVGTFPEVWTQSEPVTDDGITFRILSIDGLIAAKRTANRPKDQPGLLELEALKQARSLHRAEDHRPGRP